MTRHARFETLRGLLAVAVIAAAASRAAAQQDNPVYVNDSPRAWELFRQANDQAQGNVGEAVRLYQELLDDYGMTLLPRSEETPDQFVSVRARVLAELTGHPKLLERYRLAEAAEALRMLESNRLEALALRRPLTEAGLEALLRLAQAELEAGHFHAALDWLDEAAGHPDLGADKAAHCWYMTGAAAVYLQRPDEVRLAMERLAALGPDGVTLGDRLGRLGRGTPAYPGGVSTLDPAGQAELDQLVAQPIWSVDLDRMPLTDELADLNERGGRPRRPADLRNSGLLLTTVATVSGGRVFLNEGRVVHAVDRFTGRPLWPPYEEPEPSAMDKSNRQIADLNAVAISGSSLVTITGHAYTDANRSERSILCLDAETGALRWAMPIEQMASMEEFEGLFPHGAPVIGEGMVYVLARKMSRQLLTSCYLLAIDLAEGRLRWARHIASSGGIRSRFSRPFSAPLYHDGDIFVATSIGAVARIDATTGETRWLRRYNPPLSPYTADRRPWEIGAPVATPQGILAMRPDHREVLLLDGRTGDEIEAFGARDSWNSPRYLLAGPDMVYAVGTEIRAFRPDTLRRPIWTFPPESPLPDPDPSFELEDFELEGRVQLAGGGLLAPGAGGLVRLDAETGRPTHYIDLDSAGNPLAAGPQLIMAAADRLQAYMPLDRAEQMLRQQVAEAPADPSPALALMRLGVRARDLPLTLEAADLAMTAVGRAPGTREATEASRRELFDVLLELDRAKVAHSIEQGEALHAMIGIAARDPDQRVEHLLAYGDWLADHDLARSVEAYQAILSDRQLDDTPREELGVVRPASAWAAQRLESLIAVHGARVYEPQADFAERRLAALRRSDRGGSADDMLALAAEFPFAGAGLTAAREAAARLAAAGDHRAAMAAVIDTYRLAPVEARAAALLGPAVQYAADAGWNDQARDLLRYIEATYGPIELDAGTPRGIGEWLSRLPDGPARQPRPGNDGTEAQRIDGSVVTSLDGHAVAGRPDRVLLFNQPQLSLLSAPDLAPVWSTALAAPGAPSLLAFDDRGLLLWMDTAGNDPRVVMLDPDDGSTRWTSTAARSLRGDPARRLAEAEGGLRDKGFDPDETIPLVGLDRLVLVRRNGNMMSLSLADGETINWQHEEPGPLLRVDAALWHDLGIVLAGARATIDGRGLVPAIVVLDPADGRLLQAVEPIGGLPARWLCTDGLGSIVYGNDAGVGTVDLLGGGRWWTVTDPDLAGSTRGWAVDGFVLLQAPMARGGNGDNLLRSVRVADGAVSDSFGTPRRGEWDPLDLQALTIDDGRIFARYGKRIVRYGPTGKVLGADVVSDERVYEWLLPVEGRLLIVSLHKTDQVQAQPRNQPAFTYRVYGLSDNCRLLGDGVELPPLGERVERTAAIDGWLMLSSSTETLAVPMGQ